MHPRAEQIQSLLQKSGVPAEVREMPASTRTAQQAADTIGCDVRQIVKSLVFRGCRSGRALMVLASGPNRVDVLQIAVVVGEPVEKADADFVRKWTGFAIGGVPPLGHHQSLPTWVDEGLMQFDTVWAAAGTPNAVFSITPSELVRLTGAGLIILQEEGGSTCGE